MRILAIAASLALVLLLPRPAAAEINMADSVEWMTADADLVVRGELTAVTARAGAPGWFDVTLRVRATLKGSAPRRARVALRHLPETTLTDWLTTRRDLLLFLVKSARRVDDDPGYQQAMFAPRRGDGAVLMLDGPRVGPVFTADFTALDDRAQILTAVYRAARSPARRAHQLDVPSDTPAFAALYAGSAVWLTVPVDAALERRALAWLATTDLRLREDAVAALAYFPSSDNAATLEGLLADPGFATITESGKPTVRRYLIRARAHEVLAQWGVAHATPTIDVPARP